MKNKPSVLIVDDAQHDRFLLQGHLHDWGYASLPAESGAEALELLKAHAVDLIVSDQVMDGMDGMERRNSIDRWMKLSTLPP